MIRALINEINIEYQLYPIACIKLKRLKGQRRQSDAVFANGRYS